MKDLGSYNIDRDSIPSLLEVYLQAKQKFLLCAHRYVQTLQDSTSSPARNSKSSLPEIQNHFHSVSIRGNIKIFFIDRSRILSSFLNCFNSV